ncbi:SusC/RagA family TonB-linked outer membrane protein [Persicobacter diffluens]|uniref:SusC/RagA family TonB-linked outer membrane protein n=2 Tax=Persicobacter diffluens TaxID=981 RepID=A0AAN5ANM6_9BACT|nr:SusC/RagA family TonB-linked outer membrane protein [Persicobacter diffluens]
MLFSLIGLTQLMAQVKVTGHVKDKETGEGILGANVVVRGTTTGTVTDFNGDFSLEVPSAETVLLFSFIGYQEQSVTVGNQSHLEVALDVDATELEEVMVVAYGEQKKSSFTGSAATIKKDHIEKLQVSNVQNAIEGAVPGVQVSGVSGQPGSGTTIRIRGIGSVNASSAPLYVVDGVPFGGALNNLNPSDIESMTVLKDAAATALYGSRAANGVVMITTKKGKQGQGTVAFKARTGIAQRAMRGYDRVDQKEYYELQWEGYKNNLIAADIEEEDARLIASGQHPRYSHPMYDNKYQNVVQRLGGFNSFSVSDSLLIDPLTGRMNPAATSLYGNNWEDELFAAALRQEYSVSLSGAAETADYFVSLGYLSEDGVAKNTGFDRFSARVNVNADIKKWLNAGANISYTYTESQGTNSGNTTAANPFFFANTIAPIYPVYQREEDGNYKLDDAGQKVYEYAPSRPYLGNANALGTNNLDVNRYSNNAVSGRTYLNLKIDDHLSARTNVTLDYVNRNSLSHQNSLYGDADNVDGRSTRTTNEYMTLTMNQLISYQNSFGLNNVNALVGHESYFYQQKGLTGTAQGFPVNGLPELGVGSMPTNASSWLDEHAIESYFSRLEYNYNEKYYASFSYRLDGTSRMAPESRWGNFWALGGSWAMHRENFLKGIGWLNSLKLRGSFGEQGNENLGSNYYIYQDNYSLTYPNNSEYGGRMTYLANRNLTWEKRQATNLGLDFSVLQNKISGSVEFFNNASKDLIFTLPIAPSNGWGGQSANIGAMKNYGLEFNITADVLRRKGFSWEVDFSATHMKNEITDLPQEEVALSSSKRLTVGSSFYDFYLFEYAGVDPNNGDALYYKDLGEGRGRGVTNDPNDADRYYAGTALADLTGFINQRLNWKNFDFSLMVNYQLGGQVYNSGYQQLMNPSFGVAMHNDMHNAWKEPGQITDVPRIEIDNGNLVTSSSRFLSDASYATIRNITFGYTLPSTIAKNLYLDYLRVSFAVDNLYTFSSMQGYFPGTASSDGYLSNGYYPIRTMSLGLDVKF